MQRPMIQAAPDSETPAPLPAPRYADDEVFDIRFLVIALLRGSWLILLFALLGTYFGVRQLQGFTPVYVASLIVSPEQPSGGSPNPGVLRSIGQGLGIDIGAAPAAPATPFERLKLTLGSAVLAEQLNAKYDLLHRIYKNSWDPVTQTWIRPTGTRFEFEERVNKALHLRTWSPPTVQSFAEFLGNAIEVAPVGETAFYFVKFRDKDPEFALWLLKTVYSEADLLVRQQDLDKSLDRKAYLEQQLQRTTVLEHRLTFSSMLAAEERQLMMARSDQPYSAEIVQPAFVSSLPTTPDLVKDFGVIVVGWILAAMGIVTVFALVRSGSR